MKRYEPFETIRVCIVNIFKVRISNCAARCSLHPMVNALISMCTTERRPRERLAEKNSTEVYRCQTARGTRFDCHTHRSQSRQPIRTVHTVTTSIAAYSSLRFTVTADVFHRHMPENALACICERYCGKQQVNGILCHIELPLFRN